MKRVDKTAGATFKWTLMADLKKRLPSLNKEGGIFFKKLKPSPSFG